MARALPGRPERGPLGRALRFIGDVVEQSAQDNVLFLGAGLTFSLLVAAIPFLLVVLASVGLLLAPAFRVAPSDVMDRIWEMVPIQDPTIRQAVTEQLAGVIDSAGSLGLISGLLFLWFSARFFGSVRAALREVFDVRGGPRFPRSLLRDVGLVAISMVLLAANVLLTTLLGGVGVELLAALGIEAAPALGALGHSSAWLVVFLMFLLIYKMAPGGDPLRWRTAALAALFASAIFEAVKLAFGWYLATFGGMQRLSFALATALVIVAALYYAAVAFLLGAEVAKVAAGRRIIRARLEIFETS